MRYITIFSMILLTSCKTISNKEYSSNCKIYGKTELTLTLNADKTFIYNFLYNEVPVNGKWVINKDTLILSSDDFLITRDSMLPKNKNTDIDKFDKYLIKRNKLFIINKTSIDKECYLR